MKYLILLTFTNITNITIKINEIEKKITDHNHDKYITTPEVNTLQNNFLV